MRELNPPPKRPDPERITVWQDRDLDVIFVTFPGPYKRMTLLDENARPAHIGPTQDAPAPFPNVEAALAYWQHVDEVFRRLP